MKVIDPSKKEYERNVGNPDLDGKFLSSTIAGVRSWLSKVTTLLGLTDTPEEFRGVGTPLIINENGDGIAYGIPPNRLIEDTNALTLVAKFVNPYVAMAKIESNRVVILDGNNTLTAYEYSNNAWLKIGNSYTNLPETGLDYEQCDIAAFDSQNIYVMEEHSYSPYFTVIKKYSFDGANFTPVGNPLTALDKLTGHISVVSANKILLHCWYTGGGIQIRTYVLDFDGSDFNILTSNDDGNLNITAYGSRLLGKAHRFADGKHFAYIHSTTQNSRTPEIHTMLFDDNTNLWTKVSVNHTYLPIGILAGGGDDQNIPSILIDDRTLVIIDRANLKLITYSYDFVSKKWSLNNSDKDLGAGIVQNSSALSEIQGKLVVAKTNATESTLETMTLEESKVYTSRSTELYDFPKDLIADKYLKVSADGKEVTLVDLPTATSAPTRNYIDNGQFDFFQRGISYTFANTQQNTPDPDWVSDRWYTFLTTTSGAFATGDNTVTKETFVTLPTEINEGAPRNFLKIATVCAGSNQTYAIPIVQGIEDVRTLSGKDANLSMFIRASGDGSPNTAINIYQVFDSAEPDVLVHSGIITTTNDNTFRKYSVSITVPSVAGKVIGANSYLKVMIYARNGSNPFAGSYTTEYTNIQLVEGSDSVPYIEEPKSDIQRRCQRYFEKSYEVDHIPGTLTPSNIAARGTLQGSRIQTAISGQALGLRQFFKVSKRIIPSVAWYPIIAPSTPGNITNGQTGTPITVTSSSGTGQNTTGAPTGMSPDPAVHTPLACHWTASAEFPL